MRQIKPSRNVKEEFVLGFFCSIDDTSQAFEDRGAGDK
jgi:hypothetical protein